VAFVHGKTTTVLVDEFDLSPYFNQAQVSRRNQTTDVTTFGASERAYISGIEESTLSVQGLWDGTTGAIDDVFANSTSGSVNTQTVVTVAVEGADVAGDAGNSAILMTPFHVSYQPRSTVSDAVRLTANFTGSGPTRSDGLILHGLSAETTTGAETGIDDLAQSTFGCVAHLHVTAFTGTNCVIKVQDSTNGSTWADLITFTTVTGVTKERVNLSNDTVDRHLRVNITSGTFSSVTYAVGVARHKR
jgi:hypothetical protein